MSDDPRLKAARYRVARDLGDADAADDETAQAPASAPPEAGTTAAERAAFVEVSIQQAIRRGEFDDLPGSGKPLQGLDGTHDPDWWIRRKIEAEKLTGLGPPALLLRVEDAQLRSRLDALGREDDVRGTLDDFNRRVIEARRQLQGGPPVVTPTRDVDAEVAAWRERRATRIADETASSSDIPRRSGGGAARDARFGSVADAPDLSSVTPPPTPTPDDTAAAAAMSLRGLVKRFGEKTAVAGIDLTVPTGSFYGLVGPNGAGKTTTLSMATGLLRPDGGTAEVHGVDVWTHPVEAKAMIGNLADGVRLFDRLTGEQLVTYTGMMFGLGRGEIAARTADLIRIMDLGEAAGTPVVDYSAGMTKKIALACALVHAPRLLVLDEPFESVDPVSAANIEDILREYTASGGTVIVSSHSMDLVQRMCDHVAVIAAGRLVAAGTVDEVRAGQSLQDRFVELVGGRHHTEGPEWLRRS